MIKIKIIKMISRKHPHSRSKSHKYFKLRVINLPNSTCIFFQHVLKCSIISKYSHYQDLNIIRIQINGFIKVIKYSKYIHLQILKLNPQLNHLKFNPNKIYFAIRLRRFKTNNGYSRHIRNRFK